MVTPAEPVFAAAGASDPGDAFRAAIPTVYGYLLHRCGSVAVAEDLTQETFAAAVAAFQSGTPDATESRWLVGVARHKLVDHYRRQGRERDRLRSLVPTRRAPELEAWSQESLQDRTRDALFRLPDAQRIALVLRYMDDLSVPETARLIGRTVHATESLLARGRDRLRQLMNEEGHADG